MTRPTSALRRVRRALLARRRLLAAACAAVAVAAALEANAAPPAPRTMLLTAAHDLPSGVVLGSGDVSRTAYRPASVPSGALSDPSLVVGRTTAGPMRSGEALTDARLVTSSLLAGQPGLVVVPVRIGDPGAVRLLRVGDRVDLLAADPRGGRPAAVAGRDVPVLAIPAADQESPGLGAGESPGALVVLALPPASARVVAAASVSSVLSVVLTG